MTGAILMMVVVLMLPGVAFLMNYRKCNGRVAAFFLDQTDELKPVLCKKLSETWAITKDGCAYRLSTEKVRQIYWPLGYPRILQLKISGYLYISNETNPLDWKTVELKAGDYVSSKEIGALLEPEWLKALVRGVKEGGASGMSKMERMVMFVGAGAGVASLIMIFVVMTKLHK
jgi:hypothetical protein